MPKTPEEIIRAEVHALSAYHVPDSAGMIKLDAMENPYRLPRELWHAIVARLTGTALNRYPDPGARELKAVLRPAMQIPAGMELVLGNGSDELIQMLALAVAKPGAVMLGLEPSFAMFRLVAAFTGMRYVGVALNADFSIAAAQTLAAIEQYEPALIFIAYPNNPTGNLFDAEVVGRIIDAAPGIVVVDEAYHAFAEHSFMPRLTDYSNLLVMRTVSKLGLAGLRLGVLAGHEGWLRHIDKVRLPYNVNVLTQLVAIEALREPNVLQAQAAAIRTERARVLTELRRLAGVEAYASDANFILFRAAGADQLFNGLKQRGILIKNLNGTHPLLADCLRVTVGTPDENTQFLGALSALLRP